MTHRFEVRVSVPATLSLKQSVDVQPKIHLNRSSHTLHNHLQWFGETQAASAVHAFDAKFHTSTDSKPFLSPVPLYCRSLELHAGNETICLLIMHLLLKVGSELPRKRDYKSYFGRQT